jgi:hypothetical protein
MALSASLRMLLRRTAPGFVAAILFGGPTMRALLHAVLIALILMALPACFGVLFRGTAARVAASRSGPTLLVLLHRLSTVATVRLFAAFAADFRHVLAVRAYCLTAFAARLARFLRVELMSGTLLMRGSSTLAGNFTLTFLIHRSKSTIGRIFFCHCPALLKNLWGLKTSPTNVAKSSKRRLFKSYAEARNATDN